MGILIVFLSLIPGRNLPQAPIKFADLLVHVVMYATWTLVVCLELKKQYSGDLARFSLRMLVTIVIIRAIMEGLQEIFIPGRFGSFSDALANTFGASSAYFWYRGVHKSSK